MKALHEILLIGCGGAVGAISRYGLSRLGELLSKSGFPLGTFIANMIGCFSIGLLIGSGIGQQNSNVRMAVGVGFLGALTTFSTFAAETVSLADDSKWSQAVGNVGANLIVGLLLVVVGMAIGRKCFNN